MLSPSHAPLIRHQLRICCIKGFASFDNHHRSVHQRGNLLKTHAESSTLAHSQKLQEYPHKDYAKTSRMQDFCTCTPCPHTHQITVDIKRWLLQYQCSPTNRILELNWPPPKCLRWQSYKWTWLRLPQFGLHFWCSEAYWKIYEDGETHALSNAYER